MLEEFNVVPIFRQGIQELSEGIDVKIPTFCKGTCYKNEKCKEYYKEIYGNSDGIYTCPYGFNSYIFSNQEEKVIFTCLRIKDNYDKKKVNPKIEADESARIIEESTIREYAKLYNAYSDNRNRFNDYYEFTENIFHDVRKYNAQLKATNVELYNKSNGKKKYEFFLNKAKSIGTIAWFISLQLNSYDLTYNEEIMKQTIKSSYNIFKAFDKVRKSMTAITKDKNIYVNLECAGRCSDVQAYDCIEILPFVLFDNAVKYALNETEVSIIIDDSVEKLSFSIESIGPLVEVGEEEKIFERGFRSKQAIKSNQEGAGIGLYTAKKICNLHGAEIYAKSDPVQGIEKNGIKYGSFCIFVTIKK